MIFMDNTIPGYREVSEKENKKLLLDMMQYVHEFCEEKGIQYFLYFGSLLGAVRHKGFIPWDDDMDICMTRKEYERFIKCFPKGKDTRYSVMTYRDKNHYQPYAKIVDNYTRILEREDKPIGIYIDLFIIDNEGKTFSEAGRFMHLVSFFVRLRYGHVLQYRESASRNKIVYGARKALAKLTDENELLRIIDNVSRLKESEELSEYVGAVNASGYNERQILRGEWFKEDITVPFEDREFRIPKDYHDILKTIYVNYMDLPAESSRTGYHRGLRWIASER